MVLLKAFAVLPLVAMLTVPKGAMAQSKPPTLPKRIPNMSAEAKRGEYLFLQRCSLCHLSKYAKSKDDSELPVVWLNLEGLFKDSKPDKEKAARQVILKGTPNMPGFQYGLEPKEIDDLIVFLKTQ